MRQIRLCFALWIGLMVGPLALAHSVTGLFNTGVDDSGAVVALHAVEPHYSVLGPVDTAYRVPIVFHNPGHQAWISPPAGAAWIGPNATESTWPFDPIGLYTYRLEFSLNLSGLDDSGLRLSGRWASDNSSEIWLNNQFTGFSKGEWGFADLAPFSIESGFLSGQNVLEFRVLNAAATPNPTGLLVTDLQITYLGVPLPSVMPAPSVPEGMRTDLALMIGILSLEAGLRWRRSLRHDGNAF